MRLLLAGPSGPLPRLSLYASTRLPAPQILHRPPDPATPRAELGSGGSGWSWAGLESGLARTECRQPDRLRRLRQHGGSGEGAGTAAGLPGLNEQGAGGLASWFPERRALETQILGSDKGEGRGGRWGGLRTPGSLGTNTREAGGGRRWGPGLLGPWVGCGVVGDSGSYRTELEPSHLLFLSLGLDPQDLQEEDVHDIHR